MITVYSLDEHGEPYPVVTGYITEFDYQKLVISDIKNSIKKEIDIIEIEYLEIHDESNGSFLLYLNGAYEDDFFHYPYDERVPEGLLKEIENSEKEIEDNRNYFKDNLLTDVSDLFSLLDVLLKNQNIIYITGFDESIRVNELAKGKMLEYSNDNLILLDTLSSKKYTIIISDILYIEITDEKIEKFKFRVYLNPDKTIEF